MASRLSRQLFSKKVETGETKPNPTLRQFETYEITPLRKDIGGKYYGFKGEEIVGTRRQVRQRRGQFKEFSDMGIRGDYEGRLNRRLAPYRYGEREPDTFKTTGVRKTEGLPDRPYTSIFIGEEGENFQRSIEEIMKTPTYLEDQRYFRRPIPAIPIYVDMEGNMRRSGRNNIVSKEEFEKIAREYMVYNKDKITPSPKSATYQRLEKDGKEYFVSVLKQRPIKGFYTGGAESGTRILTKKGATGDNPLVYEGTIKPKDGGKLEYGASVLGGKGVDFPLNVKELEKDLEYRGLTKGDTGLLSLDGERVFSKLKNDYEKKYGQLTRAQQRKLGRIIKDRETKPIRIGKSVSIEGVTEDEIDFRLPTKRELSYSGAWFRKRTNQEGWEYSDSFFSNDKGEKIPLKLAPPELLKQLEEPRAGGIKKEFADKVYFTSDLLKDESGELKYNTLSYKGDKAHRNNQLSWIGFRSLKDEGIGYDTTFRRPMVSERKIFRDLTDEDRKKLKDAEKEFKDFRDNPPKVKNDLYRRKLGMLENTYERLHASLPDKLYKDDRPYPFTYDGKTYKFNIRSKKLDMPYVIVKGVKTKPVGNKYVRTKSGTNLYGESDFTMRMTGRGGGRRFYTMTERDKKLEWWMRGKNQKEVSRRIDAESVPPQQYQLRGIRDPRSAGGRIIPPRNIRRIDHSQTYKSARDEALIQMRINESAGVRGAKKKIEEVRHSEAEKRKNLVLAKMTAEETAKALKAKNAGLTHSYNVNVRNHSNATLLGSDPDELNKILARGGGIALIKDMIRKGEITDVSTIGQLDLSVRNKSALIKLLNEGSEYVEGNEYFYRFIDEFGNTKIGRGYLNKGGDRVLNLDLMYIRTNADGTTTKERRLVPKKNVISPDVSATTTSSGKQQKPRGERRLRRAELEAFGLDLGETPEALAEVPFLDPSPAVIKVGRKTRGRSEEVDRPPSQGILSALREDGAELIGGELPRQLSPASSEEEFTFDVPKILQPEPELAEEDFDALLTAEIDKMEERRSAELRPQEDPQGVNEGLLDLLVEELGGGRAGTSLQQTYAELEAQSPSAGLEEEEEEKPKQSKGTPKRARTPLGRKPKSVKFDEGVEERSFADNSATFNSPFVGYDYTETLPADNFVTVDLSRKGKKERLGELLGENEIFLWSTKYGGDEKVKRGIIVNRDDIGALLSSARGQKVRLSSNKNTRVSMGDATKLYVKVIKDINAGKQETAFNNEAIVRLLGIEPRIVGEPNP